MDTIHHLSNLNRERKRKLRPCQRREGKLERREDQKQEKMADRVGL